MSWLQSIIYGLISGLAEFLPISSGAHQRIVQYMFGETTLDPIRALFIHVGMLLALYTSMRNLFDQIRREQRLKRDRRRAQAKRHTTLDMTLVRNAATPMVIGMIVLFFVCNQNLAMPWVCVFLLINGVVLFVTERAIRGNKDAQNMSVFDSWLIGLSGSLSVLPGISRLGMGTATAVLRGADRSKALTWSLMLSVPALILLVVLDVISAFSGVPFGFFSNLGGYLLSGLAAYAGGCLSLYLIRFITARSGYLAFAYYSWGAALFSFIIYLMVV